MKNHLYLLIRKYLRGASPKEERYRSGEQKRIIFDDIGRSFEEAAEAHTAESRAVHQKLKAIIKDEIARSAPARGRRPGTILRGIAWVLGASLALPVMVFCLVMMTRPREHREPAMPVLQTWQGRQFLRLPDNSTVVLQEGSELTCAGAFGKATREVTLLKGEAYFDIAHDPSRPFLVHTGAITTRVLGTAFNVKAVKEQVIVTVARGQVAVGEASRPWVRLKQDEQVTVTPAAHRFATATVEADTIIAWKDQYLIFDNITLAEAAALLEKHYPVTVTFTNSQLKTCRLSGTFLRDDPPGKVISVLTDMLGATARQEGERITIVGGACR